MTWTTYGSFPVVAVVLVLVPGPDFAVVTKNTLAGGRPRGWSSAAGVTCSNAVQGVTAAGLGAIILGVQPLFEAIKWAGIAYLAFLAIQSMRSGAAGRYLPFDEERTPSTSSAEGWRQGFISNITKPKVLAFLRTSCVPSMYGPLPAPADTGRRPWLTNSGRFLFGLIGRRPFDRP